MTKGSKIIAISILAIWAFFGSLYVSHASDTSIIDALGWSTEQFGTNITVTWISTTQAKIVFPLHIANGETIMNYNVSYSRKSLDSADSDFSDIKLLVFSNGSFETKNGKAELLLTGLVANTTYYFVVQPINKEWTLLITSDQNSFTTLASDEIVEPVTTNEPTLGSAETSQANFTFTLSGNDVTVKWNEIEGATKFTFASKEATSTTYTNIGSELVSKEKFTFLIPTIGLYSVKIVPVDDDGNVVGAEKILTVKITATVSTPGKGTPATGPALNLVLMSTFLLMLVYVVYRFRTTK